MTTRALVEAHGVSFMVGDAVLVRAAAVTVGPGEVVAVIGPNGAGKSTFLSLLAGDLVATEGDVTLDGDRLTDLEPSQLAHRRAVLPQHIRPDVPYRARAVVAMGRFPHRQDPANSGDRDADAVAAAMAITNTAHLASRIFSTLSGGEQTRVALARVLAQETPLLLLDEPTKALDLGHQEQVLRMVRGLAAGGRGVLLVLHDLNAAAAHADRVALMAEAAIVAEGAPGDVYDEALLSDIYNEPMRVLPHPLRPGPLVLPAG